MPTSARPLPAGPFVLAIGAATTLVLAAPFVGQIRTAVRAAFPGQYLFILAGAAGLGLAVALGSAAYRIRDRRAARYGVIAIAIVVAVAYSLWNTSPSAERNAVERFHFLQYGCIAFLFYRAWRPLQDAGVIVLPLLAGFIVSAAEEWLQWFIPNRVGEINDVLLNLVAIVCGLLFSVGVEPPEELRLVVSRNTKRRMARLGIAAVGALATFLYVVHLGYVVEDAEIGRFTTRFSPARLMALQDERAAKWAVSPPPRTLVRLSREDQYLSEGMEHVRERNELWEPAISAAPGSRTGSSRSTTRRSCARLLTRARGTSGLMPNAPTPRHERLSGPITESSAAPPIRTASCHGRKGCSGRSSHGSPAWSDGAAVLSTVRLVTPQRPRSGRVMTSARALSADGSGGECP